LMRSRLADGGALAICCSLVLRTGREAPVIMSGVL
jgi:hypothetical protein